MAPQAEDLGLVPVPDEDLGLVPVPDEDLGLVPLEEEQPAGGFLWNKKQVPVPPPIMSPEEAAKFVRPPSPSDVEFGYSKGIPYLGEPTFAERAAELIPESLTAGLEAYGRAFLPFVYQKFEEAVGVPQAEQLRREEENPLAAAAGTVGGVLGGIAVGSAAGPVSFLSPFAKATTAAGAGIRAAVPAGAGVIAKTTGGAVAGAVEATALGALMEIDEAQFRNRPIKADAIVNNALVGAGVGAFLSGVPAVGRAFGENTKTGRRFMKSLGDSSARRVLAKFGATPSQVRDIEKQIGREREMGILSEAADSGMVDFFRPAAYNFERAQLALDEAGTAIGRFAKAGDARIAAAGEGAPELAPDIVKIGERIYDEVIFPLSKEGSAGVTEANKLAADLRTYVQSYGRGMNISDLSAIRTQISKEIYGLRGVGDPQATLRKSELRKVRNILTDEIGTSLERVGIKREAWRVPQRKYEVASRIEQLADGAVAREIAKPPLDMGDVALQLAASGVGYAEYGPYGLGAGLGIKLAKNAYTDVSNWAPTAARRFLGAGAPSDVVLELQKYSDDVAKAREGVSSQYRWQPPEVTTTIQARAEQLKIKDSLIKAVDDIKNAPDPTIYDPSIVRRLEEISKGFSWNPLRSPQDTAKLLEDTEKALTDISRMGVIGKVAPSPVRAAPGAPAFMQNPAIQVVRGVRDEIRASLAQPEIFGGAYRDAAERRMVASSLAMRDPAQMATLQGLEELATGMQRRIETGADKMMGYAATTAKQSSRLKRDEHGRLIIEISYKEAQREREEMQKQLQQQSQQVESPLEAPTEP